MEILEKTMKNGILDFIFPWHMQLGRFEEDSVLLTGDRELTPEEKAEDVGFAYTPFKTFNRRRNFLVWLHSRKFDSILSDEEKELLTQIEK